MEILMKLLFYKLIIEELFNPIRESSALKKLILFSVQFSRESVLIIMLKKIIKCEEN